MPKLNRGVLTPTQAKRRAREARSMESTLGLGAVDRKALGIPTYSASYLQKKATALKKQLSWEERYEFEKESKRLGLTKRDQVDYLILRGRSEQTRLKIEEGILQGALPSSIIGRKELLQRRTEFEAEKIAKSYGMPYTPEYRKFIKNVPKVQQPGDLKFLSSKAELGTKIREELIPAAKGVDAYMAQKAKEVRDYYLPKARARYGENGKVTQFIQTASDKQILDADASGKIKEMISPPPVKRAGGAQEHQYLREEGESQLQKVRNVTLITDLDSKTFKTVEEEYATNPKFRNALFTAKNFSAEPNKIPSFGSFAKQTGLSIDETVDVYDHSTQMYGLHDLHLAIARRDTAVQMLYKNWNPDEYAENFWSYMGDKIWVQRRGKKRKK